MGNELIKIVDEDVVILQKLIQRDQLLKILNVNPPDGWIKEHPFAKGVKYIPIEKIELLLTRIFQEWQVEIKREGQLAQSIFVTVRLHYKDPIDSEWRWQDGTGAAPIQTDSGASAADLAKIKNNAVMLGLPAAESFAVKDAAEKIGKLFGKDLNRKDVMDFAPSYDTEEAKKKIREKLYEDN